MTPTFMNSPFRVIENAYFEAGKIEEGQEPSSEMYAKGMVRMNDLMSLWQTQGLRLWLQTDLAIPLIAGQGTYTIGPTGNVVMTRPTRIIEAYYVDADGTSRPVFLYSRNEWDTLSQKETPGVINSIFVDKQVPYLIVNCWQVPDDINAEGLLHVIIQQQQPLIVQLTDNLLFGPEWFLALVWGMAEQLATGSPQAVIAKCQGKATEYRLLLEDWDVEDANTFFTPDPRLGFSSGRFT